MAAVALLGLGAARAQVVAVASPRQLADLSLEELSNLVVTSVSGRSESLQHAAASIYVITAQEIRRSAATSLPEALRLAPNLQVAQTSAGQFAISARGFQDLIANKLLVLVDGRTVYSPLFAGVFWDANDVVLEDIDRIEVISGPGGTLWGANAVNGVINVVTRNAGQTQGTLLSVTRSHEGGRAVARWGTPVGDHGHVRLYALTMDRASTRLPSGVAQQDASSRTQAGFRGDWSWGSSASFTLQGDAYQGGDEPANALAPKLKGGNLLARWRSTLGDGSPYVVQAYYDLADRDDLNLFRNRVATRDFQFSNQPAVGVGQLLWGFGHREAKDENIPNATVLFLPNDRSLKWSNVFAQYQWPVAYNLQATAGIKFERNSYTGVEKLPSLRLAWLHSADTTTWASASRAVRAPARIDRDFFFPGTAPFVIAGGPNFQSEVANVYEIGHRGQHGSTLSWSVTLFRDAYEGLRSGVPGRRPNTVENLVEGRVQGLEAWGSWQAATSWRLTAGYLTLHKRLRYCCGLSPETTSFPGLGVDAREQWSLRSSHDWGSGGELDIAVRRVGGLSAAVPAYIAVDGRIAMQLAQGLHVALVGRNLFDPRHVEYFSTGAGGAPNSEFRRRWLLQATWAF